MAFTSFVVLAGMRTGSNLLEDLLNALPGVACHGEAFNPGFIGRLGQTSAFGLTLEDRDADPLGFLRRLQAQPGLNGFRHFADHDPRVRAAVMDDPGCAKIVLTRHPLDSYLSLQIARATGQWKLSDPARRREAKAHFDPAGFRAFLDRHRRTQAEILRDLQTRGQAAFWIGYDDLLDLSVLNGLAAFLGVAARLDGLAPGLVRQNPEAAADKVDNPAEMAAALAGIDWIDLDHGPAFEPRRAAAVPSFRAAGPLLFLPVPGGPVAEIDAWLARIGPVESGFTRKALRQWRAARPGHRSFAVLRHPLARAFAAFAGPVLGGDLPDIRRVFARTMRLDLPEPAAATDLPAGLLRPAFLAWLRFARMTLAGQTAARVDAHIATQAAVLQGFAGLQPPDLVLREDRLAAGIAFLASETGAALPPAPAIAPDPRLTALADAEVRAAAADAYRRDMTAFGFRD